MIEPGRNIAIKVPLYRWEETVAFYRDRAGLRVKSQTEDSIAFEFGAMTLWVDRVAHQSQADVWLELIADDADRALKRLGGPRRDELEPLDGVTGLWISDPAGVVILLRSERG